MQGIFDSNTAAKPAVEASGTNGAIGLQASSDTGTAIGASGRIGISTSSKNGVGIAAYNIGQGMGVRATSDDGWGVNAQSKTGIGVLGVSDQNVGVQGICQEGDNFGVSGTGANAGIAAFNLNNSNAAYLASVCCAAWFTGGVTVTGKLLKGGGGFRIDHPMDPDKKFLSHSFVESPDMKNVYDGTVTADKKGMAVIQLPKWFDSINSDFRYQLTAIGGSAPDLHISQEIKNNRFTVAGGKPGMKICWQVTGIRKDKWAEANRITVEENKNPNEHGYYLHPELYHAIHKGIANLRHKPVETSNHSGSE
ncbi:MAG TPA: hypothetical protein VNS58_08920 [Puia sp.]|nr:hypothetical protein [Puia sp.]